MLEFGPFLTLLGALWVTFIPVTGQIKALNDIRDKILFADSKYLPEHRRLFFRNDWVPLFISSIVQQAILVFLLFWIPKIAPISVNVPKQVSLLCLSLAIFAVLRLLGFIVAFLFDLSALRKSVAA